MRRLLKLWTCDENGRMPTPEEEREEILRRSKLRAGIDAVIISVFCFYLTVALGVTSILGAVLGIVIWRGVVTLPFKAIEAMEQRYNAVEQAERERQMLVVQEQREQAEQERKHQQEKLRQQRTEVLFREMMSGFVIEDP